MQQQHPQNITDKLTEKYSPKAALIVYENDRISPSSDHVKYYLETRPVKSDGTLGPARPVTKKFIKTMVETFRYEGERIPQGPVPPNLLYANPAIGTETYVWWNPPRKRKMYFTSNIPMEEAEYNVPGTIYRVQNGRLEVYCFDGRRPKPNGDLRYGPFYNYYADGGICLGNASAPWPSALTWQAVLDHWEHIFWDSENSHMMHNPCVEGKNLNLVLKDSIEAPFDVKVLAKTGKKIRTLL